jgi:predicted PhzF superfamily epimerase YddE/YHI9
MTVPAPVFTVDAFTQEAFGGNPAGVCLLDAPADATWMQAVATEMNLPETAFTHPSGPGYALRWFTPTVEVPLCGHATLATAHVLWESGRVARDERITFATARGELVASRAGAAIELDLPSDPPVQVDAPSGLLEVIGQPPRWTGRARVGWLVEVSAPAEVEGLAPDMALVEALGEPLVVTAAGGRAGHDFTSRFFAPAIGIPEDPVTGAAHCALAPYWTARLGRERLVGYQGSSRGGAVGVRVQGDRALLEGRAVTVMAGTLLAE